MGNARARVPPLVDELGVCSSRTPDIAVEFSEARSGVDLCRHAVLVDSWLLERFSVLPDDTDFSSALFLLFLPSGMLGIA